MSLIMEKVKGGKLRGRFANIDKIVGIVDEVQNLYLSQMTRIELASRNSDINEDILKRKVEKCVGFRDKKVVINEDYTISFFIRNTPINLLATSARNVQIFREMVEYILEYIKEFKIEVTTEDGLTEDQIKKFKQRYNRGIHLNKRVDTYCSTHKAIDFEDFRELFKNMIKNKVFNATAINSLSFCTVNPYVNYFVMFKMTKGELKNIYINREIRESNICKRQTFNYVLTAEDNIASVFKDEISRIKYEVEDILSMALKEIEKELPKKIIK